MLVVDFLETMKIQDNETERRAIAMGAIQFFFKGLAEEAAIVKTSKGIGNSVELQLLQFVVLDDDRNAEEAGRCQNIHQGSFQSDGAAEKFGEFAAAREHFVPKLDALGLAQIEVSGRAKVTLEKLTARREV